MKKQIIHLCAFALIALSACNKGDMPAPSAHSGSYEEPAMRDVYGTRKQATARLFGKLPYSDSAVVLINDPRKIPVTRDTTKYPHF